MARKHPPAEMLGELQDTFAKYNWSGKPIGIQAATALPDGQCPPDKSPKEITYQLPDGTWVTKVICV